MTGANDDHAGRPTLLANLGAEEGEGGRPDLPAVRSAARLWRMLFEPEPAFDWLPRVAADAAVGAGASLLPWYRGASAEQEARHRGLDLTEGPPPDVVDTVHDKSFALAVAHNEGLEPTPFVGCVRAWSSDELADPATFATAVNDALAAWPAWARARAALKPRRGSSGRGRVDLATATPEQIAGALPRLARCGGAILEPWVERSHDLSVAMQISTSGELSLLGTLHALNSPAGTPRGHWAEIDSRGRVFSGREEDDEMRGAAASVAVAARDAGYSGPCGVDGFVFHDESGRPRLRPVCEFNARFTMGIVALGLMRRHRPLIREKLGLAPGMRAGVLFAYDEPSAGWEALLPSNEASHVLRLFDGAAPGPALVMAREPTELEPLAAAVLGSRSATSRSTSPADEA